LLIGVPVLFALNLARLLMLGWVGLRSQQSFAALHEFWWPAIQVAVAGLGWFAWVRLVVERRGPIPEAIVGRSHQIATVLVFAGVFTTLGVVGFWGHGMDLYGQLLRVPLGLAVKLLWPTTFALHDVPADRVLHSYGLHYALFTAVVALFMASPGIAWRKRLRGLLTTGIPIVMGLQVGVVLTLLSITVAGRGGGGGAERFFESWCNSVFVAAHAGLALIVWHGWATRARCRALQRQARRTRRRQTSKR
jgi:hypothetical protein